MLKRILPVVFLLSTLGATAQNTGIDKNNMNLSVKPGDDFYEFAAGGWKKNHPLTDEYSSYGQFHYLNENARKQIRTLIETFAASNEPQGSEKQKIGSLYNLSMDSIRRNNEGVQPVKPLLQMLENVKNIAEYQIVTAKLSRRGAYCMMMDIDAGADQTNANQNIVAIMQGGIGLGVKDYYTKSDSATLAVKNAYQQYLKTLFQLAGYKDAEKKAEIVLNIETRIAQSSNSLDELRDVEANYNKIPYIKLVNDYPSIDWGNIMLALGIPSVENVDLSQPKAIAGVEEILKTEKLENLISYAQANVLTYAADKLDDKFAEAKFIFSSVVSGARQDAPRWKKSVDYVNRAMGEAIGKYYVEKHFPEQSKKRMLQLVENLKIALKQRINSLEWMGDSTKMQAIDKLNSFYIKIGYPDSWKDYSALKVDEKLSFFDNALAVAEFNWLQRIEKRVNKPVDKQEWHMTPQTVNAYYNPTTNEICFPAGILQPPFFNPEADDACNYGAIGVVIGHEMSHGFDDQGSQFDKFGNVNNWWTVDDKKNFEKRTKILADFFSWQEVLPGVKINGNQTLGENIGDNGGLNIAYQAFKNATKSNPLSTVDGFTPEQRFFISYGLIWAQNQRDAALRHAINVDVHSPAKWRVNAALPMVDAWYNAFGIKKKDKLYVAPSKRAHIW